MPAIDDASEAAQRDRRARLGTPSEGDHAVVITSTAFVGDPAALSLMAAALKPAPVPPLEAGHGRRRPAGGDATSPSFFKNRVSSRLLLPAAVRAARRPSGVQPLTRHPSPPVPETASGAPPPPR